jgi:RNA polymerase sigma-70 factor (ECF subfamily)
MDAGAKASAARPGPEGMSSRQAQFDALVRALSADLYRFAFWLCRDQALAQDLVQETFLRAWRAMDDLRDGAAAKAWLITILRREHARLYERKSLERVEVEPETIVDEAFAGPEAGGDAGTLRKALAALPRKYREPLVMQVLGGHSCQEIADALGLTPQAVMTQLFRARQKLRAVLEGRDGRGVVHELS